MTLGCAYDPIIGCGWLGLIFLTIFWALIVVGVFALIRWFGQGGKRGWYDHSAIDVLRERYAKGEINRKEFEEKKKDLEVG